MGDSLSAFADDMQTLEDASPQTAQASMDVKAPFQHEDMHSCDMLCAVLAFVHQCSCSSCFCWLCRTPETDKAAERRGLPGQQNLPL